MKQIPFLLHATLCTIVLLSCIAKTPEPKGMPGRRSMVTPAIEGFVAKPVTLDRSMVVSGTLKPFEETVLMPEVTGRVVKVNLPEGKPVGEGILLVKLFDGDLQAQLSKVRAQLEIARRTEERLGELIKVNGVSRSEYDQSVLQVDALAADSEVLAVQIRKTEVRSPYNGVLGLRNISPGAQVTPSTPLVTIRAIDKMKLDFSVPEKYSREVVRGMQVTFSIEGDDTTLSAIITATEQGIDPTTRNMKVRALVEKNDGFLKPGSFARVTLRLGAVNDALMIPTQAIIPEERNKRVIVVKSGRAAFVTVQTGVRRESLVEVAEGLSLGDTVATTGLLFIKPGVEVKFTKVVR
jgi:membrane fusion protein (multidrug efflux system)